MLQNKDIYADIAQIKKYVRCNITNIPDIRISFTRNRIETP